SEWDGWHEETDLDRLGGSCRRSGRGYVFPVLQMGRKERRSTRGGAGADAHGRERGSFCGFRRTPASPLHPETLRLDAKTASGGGLRAVCQRKRIRLR